ncbi:MAG: homocysteine S-methyltransferase family protein, partial [Gaiellales bacterium]
MAYSDIKRRLDAGEVLLLDGGVGTELERRGADMDPAAWCGVATLANEELLTQIHLDYARAGSDVITANTFASSRVMLSAAGHGEDVVEINQRAVEAALRAKEQLAAEGRTVAVAGSLSHLMPMIPGTATVDPALVPTPKAVGEAFSELAGILKAAGVDLILLEMMYEPGRAQLAIDAAVGTGLPVWFGMSARRGAAGEVLSFH